MMSRNEETMMALILDVAKKDSRILAVLQDGSRSNPNVKPDIFQDYDIIYVVETIAPFLRDHRWVDVFGERMIMQLPEDMELYPPDPDLEGAFSYLMQLKDGNRIDLMMVPLDKLAHFTSDSLCKIIWDKAGLFKDHPLPLASDDSYIVRKPSERAFTDCCNEFWYTNAGLAKGLWREEVILVQELMNQVIRGALMQMLHWYIGCQHEFAVNPGKMGKFYQRYLEPEMYARLLATYPVAALPAIRESVYVAMDLFRDAAAFVASESGYSYPEEWDKEVRAYVMHVQQLPKDAQKIYHH
ncbi:aminoglycoside 6-adenylyltransferase [Chitinophaga qingshengii]|uniref:Aminoglycoside 6-adenylyltransferase n=1 Tax=Chitinophaga qingshengii TaxID=1569794 RepID=A0ABR7TMV7_9BACT|nr:aminoglycoside 6-adenylyltransferase [Chitinophaga qingshengii]MBC9931816.1 aminoglycoside 6-adenylyltransferase [Chitinophaga qingshengii]